LPIQRLLRTTAPRATVVVRLLVGAVFFLEGIKKFLFPVEWGAGRFATIGIWQPRLSAPFVGAVEIVCGALIAAGLLTRAASLLLLVDISVAILTTKLPLLLSKGFWAAEAEARTDYAMLMGLVFLLAAGAGVGSLDDDLAQRERRTRSGES
jgi:putative oxidoreductase